MCPVSSFALHTNEEPIGWLNGKNIDESCRVSWKYATNDSMFLLFHSEAEFPGQLGVRKGQHQPDWILPGELRPL